MRQVIHYTIDKFEDLNSFPYIRLKYADVIKSLASLNVSVKQCGMSKETFDIFKIALNDWFDPEILVEKRNNGVEGRVLAVEINTSDKYPLGVFEISSSILSYQIPDIIQNLC